MSKQVPVVLNSGVNELARVSAENAVHNAIQFDATSSADIAACNAYACLESVEDSITVCSELYFKLLLQQ